MMKVTELGVKVIGRQSSPFVIRIKIALNIKGILYEFVDEDIIGNQGGILSDVVFIHAGNEITEPYEIVQYIDETWKTVDTPSILPTDMYDSIVQTFWVKFIDNKIELAMKEILTKSTDVQEFDKTMEILECAFQRCSQGKNFFGGKNMNYIDICFGSMLGFILSAENKLTDIKNYLEDTVKNGGTPFNKAHGMSIFEYASKDLVFNKTFNICMYSHSMITLKKILNSYTGFNDLKTLVDVGGSVGVTLKTIISKYPNINGINFDLPHVIANAPIIQGVNHVIGNMFENIPSGDAILLKWILHDWSDEQCILLLKKCWETLGEKGKVIVIEGIVPISPNARNPIFESDVNMLTYCKGGKERTEMEFSSLAKKAGFSCFKISLTISNYISVMEFIK